VASATPDLRLPSQGMRRPGNTGQYFVDRYGAESAACTERAGVVLAYPSKTAMLALVVLVWSKGTPDFSLALPVLPGSGAPKKIVTMNHHHHHHHHHHLLLHHIILPYCLCSHWAQSPAVITRLRKYKLLHGCGNGDITAVSRGFLADVETNSS